MKNVKDIKVHSYELERRDLKGIRKGLLLKFLFEDETEGVSDCHPWLEKNDPTLKKITDSLKVFDFSLPFLKRCLEIAIEDSEDSILKFKTEDRIKSHVLVSLSEKLPEEYEVLKIKLGEDLRGEIKTLKEGLRKDQKLRLDLNYRVKKEEFSKWILYNRDFLSSHVEFIEDPFLFDEKLWVDCYKEHMIPLAWDHDGREEELPRGFQVLVLKPQAFNVTQKVLTSPFCVTSYLGHPIEQVYSYQKACSLHKQYPHLSKKCGVMNFFYKENEASKNLEFKDEKLFFPEEKHWGFDSVLKRLKWKSIGSL